jgi:hypothetical protein
MFATGSRLRMINGFMGCGSLCRIEIPASVKEISKSAFCECTALMEVIFPADTCLRHLNGFHGCKSLDRLEVPASVETLGCLSRYSDPSSGFVDRGSRREVVCRSGTLMKPVRKQNNLPAFITFEDDNDLKNRRRRVQGQAFPRLVETRTLF